MLGAVPDLGGIMYKAYGFVIARELELPELQRYDADPGSRPDITIRVAPASKAAVAAGSAKALVEGTGMPSLAQVEEMKTRVEVRVL